MALSCKRFLNVEDSSRTPYRAHARARIAVKSLISGVCGSSYSSMIRTSIYLKRGPLTLGRATSHFQHSPGDPGSMSPPKRLKATPPALLCLGAC